MKNINKSSYKFLIGVLLIIILSIPTMLDVFGVIALSKIDGIAVLGLCFLAAYLIGSEKLTPKLVKLK